MKGWKKLVVVTSLSFALGFGGGYIMYPKLQPRITPGEAIVEKNDIESYYPEFAEKYKKLSLQNLLVQGNFKDPFHTGTIKKMDKTLVVLEQVTIESSHWTVDYFKRIKLRNDKDEYSKLSPREMYRKSLTENEGSFNILFIYEDGIQFETHYNIKGEPFGIIMSNTKDPSNRIHFLKRLDSSSFLVNYYNSSEDKPLYGFIEDERLIKSVEEFFNIAAKNYEEIESLESIRFIND